METISCPSLKRKRMTTNLKVKPAIVPDQPLGFNEWVVKFNVSREFIIQQHTSQQSKIKPERHVFDAKRFKQVIKNIKVQSN